MVVVKVRETYDLKTVKDKMTAIVIHTPRPSIIQKNFPGLLMQCKAYRPLSASVEVGCASALPLDPRGIGLTTGSVAPEDMFNPILYKSITNVGMSQLEQRMFAIAQLGSGDVSGPSLEVETDNVTGVDNFAVYYGLLQDAHGWRHAHPTRGLSMRGLRPYVFETLYNYPDNVPNAEQYGGTTDTPVVPANNTTGNGTSNSDMRHIRGNARPHPFINCTSLKASNNGGTTPFENQVTVQQISTPWINCVCGVIIMPPSRLQELFYRCVVEWSIEFTGIRSVQEITTFASLGSAGNTTHFANYSYTSAKEMLTGSAESILTNDGDLISSNVDIEKVM